MSHPKNFLIFTLTALGIGFLGGCATLGTAGYGGSDPIWTPPAAVSPTPEPTALTLQNLSVPAEYGSLKETWDSGKVAPIILHIEDASGVYTAQKRSAAILDHLIRQHGLYLVLVEGGTRNDSLSHMRSYASLEKRRHVAEESLRAGKISGKNYLDLATDHNFLVYGVEKLELYDAQMQAQKEVLKAQSAALRALNGYNTAIGRFKRLRFPKKLDNFDRRQARVRAGSLPLLTHCQMLLKECEEAGVRVDLTQYPTLDRFLKEGSMGDAILRADYEVLIDDVDAVSDRLMSVYAETSEVREFLPMARDVDYFGDMVELKLSHRKYVYCAARKKEFKPEVWAERFRVLNEAMSKEDMPFYPALRFDPVPLQAAMEPAFRFYEIVLQRDQAMVENTLKQVEKANVPFAVLIAGGFHTPEINRLLKERQISYAVIAPWIGRVPPADAQRHIPAGNAAN